MQHIYTSYIIFKCLFAQVVAFSNSTTCELQGQKKKILLSCIFTGNTWIYHQMVMFLLKASYFPSLKKSLLHSLRFRACKACESQRTSWRAVIPSSPDRTGQLPPRTLALTATVITCRRLACQHSVIGKGLMRPHGSLRD